MARRAAPVVPRFALSPDWRENGKWKVTAMLASIPPDDYLPQARAFENHHLANQTTSSDWPLAWRDWCRQHSPRQPPGVTPVPLATRPRLFEAPVPEPERKRPRLFGVMPLAIDLYCGLGGWTEGLIAEGFRVVGFDLEDMHAKFGIPRPRGFQLVLQDVRTLHGWQFRNAALIVASPPCQKYSYMGMPWKRGKELARWYNDPAFPERIADLNQLFNECFRIQREASQAARRHIPMVLENVKAAQPWVGRSRWNFGSYHLWGDVPALMPVIKAFESSGMNWSDQTIKGHDFTRIAGRQLMEGIKGVPHRTTGHWTNPAEHEGIKHHGSGEVWFDTGPASFSSKSMNRKAASAMIAKIPLPLARHIASVYRP